MPQTATKVSNTPVNEQRTREQQATGEFNSDYLPAGWDERGPDEPGPKLLWRLQAHHRRALHRPTVGMLVTEVLAANEYRISRNDIAGTERCPSKVHPRQSAPASTACNCLAPERTTCPGACQTSPPRRIQPASWCCSSQQASDVIIKLASPLRIYRRHHPSAPPP